MGIPIIMYLDKMYLVQDVQPEFPISQIYFALQLAQYPEIHLFVETEI